MIGISRNDKMRIQEVSAEHLERLRIVFLNVKVSINRKYL